MGVHILSLLSSFFVRKLSETLNLSQVKFSQSTSYDYFCIIVRVPYLAAGILYVNVLPESVIRLAYLQNFFLWLLPEKSLDSASCVYPKFAELYFFLAKIFPRTRNGDSSLVIRS